MQIIKHHIMRINVLLTTKKERKKERKKKQHWKDHDLLLYAKIVLISTQFSLVLPWLLTNMISIITIIQAFFDIYIAFNIVFDYIEPFGDFCASLVTPRRLFQHYVCYTIVHLTNLQTL